MPKKGHSEEQIIAALKQQERSIASLLFATFHLLTELRDATLARGAGGSPPQ